MHHETELVVHQGIRRIRARCLYSAFDALAKELLEISQRLWLVAWEDGAIHVCQAMPSHA